VPMCKPPKPDDKPQFERFIEAAKKVGAAKTDEGLPSVIRKVAVPKAKHQSPKNPRL